MTAAPNTSEYLLVNPDTVDLPYSRIFTADPVFGNLQVIDSGPGGTLHLTPTLNLLSIVQQSTPGMIAYTGSAFVHRTLISNSSIAIGNPNGTAGNPVFDVVDDTNIQRIVVQNAGTPTANPRSRLNFIGGANVVVHSVDNAGANRTDVTITANSGLPLNSSVFLTSSTVGHSFDVGSLTSGLLKIGVSGSIATPATAIAGTDYQIPTATLTQIGALSPTPAGEILTTSSGVWTALAAGTSGYVLESQGPGLPLVWAPSASPSLATYLTQTGAALPVNGVNLGASNAHLGIGLTTPTGAALDILNTTGDNSIRSIVAGAAGNIFTMRSYSAGSSNGDTISTHATRGTYPAFAHTQNNDNLFSLQAGGSSDTAFVAASAKIDFVATDTFSVSSFGTAITFATTPNGTTAPVVAMTLGNNGFLGIGTTTPTQALHVVGNIIATGTISGGGGTGFVWNRVTGTSQTLVADNGYVATNAGLTTFTCPATAVLGATFSVYAETAAGWRIIPGTATQTIRFGNLITTPNTGSISSTSIGDSIEFVCIDATISGSEIFGVVPGAVGNLTIV